MAIAVDSAQQGDPIFKVCERAAQCQYLADLSDFLA